MSARTSFASPPNPHSVASTSTGVTTSSVDVADTSLSGPEQLRYDQLPSGAPGWFADASLIENTTGIGFVPPTLDPYQTPTKSAIGEAAAVVVVVDVEVLLVVVETRVVAAAAEVVSVAPLDTGDPPSVVGAGATAVVCDVVAVLAVRIRRESTA